MRTTWNGSISFGLVSIPVGLAPATKPAARASDVSFRMLHRECGTPIKQKRFCPVHERDLGPDEIVKGWEVAKGQFVIVEDEEIEALQNSDDSRSIEISRFVDASEVDPIFFDRTYFLVPAQETAARRPYVLLLNAMNESGMAALGRFVQQGREKLCLIRPKGDALALETLFLAADVYSQAEIEEAVEETSVKAPELALAQQVIESLAGEFDAVRAPERLPARPEGAARGEAGRRGDRRCAGAGRGGGADGRPDGGAPPQRRGGEVGQAGRERRRQEEGGAEEGIRAAEKDRGALTPAQDRNPQSGFRSRQDPKGPLARPALLSVNVVGASRPALRAALRRGSCRSCPGRWVRLPRCTPESLPAGRSELLRKLIGRQVIRHWSASSVSRQ